MLGRGKGLKAGFQINQVRGLYDDDEEEDVEGGEGSRGMSAGKIRRKGIIYFVPRINGSAGVAAPPSSRISDQGGEGGLKEIFHTNGCTQSSALSLPVQGGGEGEEGGEVGEEDVFGGEIPGLGFLSYIADSDDGVMRACALRTIVVSMQLSDVFILCPCSLSDGGNLHSEPHDTTLQHASLLFLCPYEWNVFRIRLLESFRCFYTCTSVIPVLVHTRV